MEQLACESGGNSPEEGSGRQTVLFEMLNAREERLYVSLGDGLVAWGISPLCPCLAGQLRLYLLWLLSQYQCFRNSCDFDLFIMWMGFSFFIFFKCK